MKKILLFVVCLYLLLPGNCQNIKQYVSDNLKAIRSVDPQDTDFTDLEPIGKAIGNKKIVMLGELFHGDGTTFYAKARLVRYLHEKLGFNVMAFESDFFALNHGWNAFRNHEISIDTLLQYAIYPVWTCCEQCSPFFDYLMEQAINNEMVVTGFDNQIMSGYTRQNLKRILDSFLKKTGVDFTKSSEYEQYLSLIDSAALMRGKATIKVLDTLLNFSSLILQQLKTALPENSFYINLYKNLLVFYEEAREYWMNGKNSKQTRSLRDKQMAENLKWLVSYRYPKEKIIVWAHNGHINKNSDVNYNKKYNNDFAMGYYFTRETTYLNDCYILGFTEYSGFGQFINQQNAIEVSKPPKNSLENWIKEIGYSFAFVDFAILNEGEKEKNTSFSMKYDINRNAKTQWQHFFDGIFYIEKMEPCKKTNGVLKNK